MRAVMAVWCCVSRGLLRRDFGLLQAACGWRGLLCVLQLVACVDLEARACADGLACQRPCSRAALLVPLVFGPAVCLYYLRLPDDTFRRHLTRCGAGRECVCWELGARCAPAALLQPAVGETRQSRVPVRSVGPRCASGRSMLCHCTCPDHMLAGPMCPGAAGGACSWLEAWFWYWAAV